MTFLEIKKIPSPYLKLKMLKRISTDIDRKFEN